MTPDGVEFQFGTNHLGHFALTGLLLESMLPVHGSRVVTISSLAHRVRASTNFDDVHRPFDRVAAYGRSKLANLLFTYELQRRLSAHRASTLAVAAHPGNSRTGLFRSSPGWIRIVSKVLAPLASQSAKMGALPTLRAATDRTVRGGQYFGPSGPAEQRGYPKVVHSSASRMTRVCSSSCGGFQRNWPASPIPSHIRSCSRAGASARAPGLQGNRCQR